MKAIPFLALWTALVLAIPAPARAQRVDERFRRGARDAVAITPRFTIYSSFWHNLHDYLYSQARGATDSADGAACIDGLSAADRDGFKAADGFYRTRMGERHHRRDPLMRATRLYLSGMASAEPGDPLFPDLVAAMRQAAPAYRACWWAEHDRRNRQWILALVPRLQTYGDTLATLTAGYFHAEWPGRIPVDVVTYASPGGANTITEPAHMFMASPNPGYQGDAALEMIFHEGSHTLVGPGFGALSAQIERASRALGQPAPRNLWHAVLFFTTGTAVQRLLADAGKTDYVPYAYARGVFDRAWPTYLEPMERHWRPYLNGEVDLERAVSGLVDAIVRR